LRAAAEFSKRSAAATKVACAVINESGIDGNAITDGNGGTEHKVHGGALRRTAGEVFQGVPEVK
jgi:hypothetical protein